MDLSFIRFEPEAAVTLLAPDLAVLLVGIAARQAASPTALFQARIDRRMPLPNRFAPADGAFHAGVATLMRADRQG